MRLLLDTHATYWYIEGDPQLSATVRTLIQDASNDILISPASYWLVVGDCRWQPSKTPKVPYAHSRFEGIPGD